MTRSAEPLTLDLALPADGVAGLRQSLGPALGRARRHQTTWHDSPDGALARSGVAVAAWNEGRHAGWRAEALDPGLSPGAPAPVVSRADTRVALASLILPERLAPVQRLDGRVREGSVAEVALRLVEGRLDGGPSLARLRLSGPAAEVTGLALSLAGEVRLAVPLLSLAAEALAQAGLPVPCRRLGAPRLQPGLAPGDAFAAAAGHLLGVLLHHAAAASAGQVGEPVHQMRVALRRLRALASVFRAAVACPELEQLRPGLRTLASALGPARDWDVFLEGIGPLVQAAFPQDAGMVALLERAAAQRDAAYAGLAALLEGSALRCLAIRTAAIVLARPWEGLPDRPAADMATFGTAVLARRWRRIRRPDGGFKAAPEAALHALRLRAKRLRYAAEAFAPLHPDKAGRFLKRLAELQETLGHLNDGASTTALMQALADEGGRGLAGGLVRGFVAGRAGDARKDIARAWKRLREVERFWEQ